MLASRDQLRRQLRKIRQLSGESPLGPPADTDLESLLQTANALNAEIGDEMQRGGGPYPSGLDPSALVAGPVPFDYSSLDGALKSADDVIAAQEQVVAQKQELLRQRMERGEVDELELALIDHDAQLPRALRTARDLAAQYGPMLPKDPGSAPDLTIAMSFGAKWRLGSGEPLTQELLAARLGMVSAATRSGTFTPAQLRLFELDLLAATGQGSPQNVDQAAQWVWQAERLLGMRVDMLAQDARTSPGNVSEALVRVREQAKRFDQVLVAVADLGASTIDAATKTRVETALASAQAGDFSKLEALAG